MKNKVLSIFTAIIMFCSILCVMPSFVTCAVSFVPRLTQPTTDNVMYYADNPYYKSGYGIPNCTCYAWGRAWEILGSKPNILTTGNAGTWWWTNQSRGIYSYGSTPKLGAIACWDQYDKNKGHVAVVEKIEGNRVTISESHYGSNHNGTPFDTRTMNADSSDYLTKYRFLGYIYIGEFDSSNQDTNTLINTTVDSSYATPWNGEPTATSGLITVYNEYGTAYPQNQRNIAHNDQCTVHEVYTSGFCKVTYPTASGSRTEYAKASDFNIPRNINNKPQGVLDAYVGGTGSVFVRGWGFDKDNLSAQLETHVYVWNVNDLNTPICIGGIIANKSRIDVNDYYGCGNNHGFEDLIYTKLPTGEYQIKVALLDTAGGEATWLEGGNIKITADTTAPTITSVKISDITLSGYKVTITASDNVGVSKVAIPTWTDYNGQDDLFANWDNTALATRVNDTTWTYNVKVSDHKNEYGWYNTDVYVYDNAGNYTKHDSNNGNRKRVEVGMYPLTVDPNGGTVKDENGKVVTSAFKTSKNKLIYNGTNFYSLTWTSPSKTGYSFTGYYTAKTGGTQIYGTDGKCLNEGTYFKDNHYQKASSLIVYAQWKAIPYKRTLVLDGGTCDKTYVTVTYGQKIGTLPTPKKNGYTFEGWYTGKTDGEKVTADTVITVAGDASLYARWKAIPVTTTTKKVTTTTTKVTTTTTKKVTTTTTKPVTTTTKNITTTTTSKPITTVTTTTKPIITPTTTTVPELEPTVKGDANGDNTVDVADVVIVKCYLINSSNYSISKQGVVNVDVHESGNGINIQDVLAIQKKVLKIIDDFDSM